MQRCILFFLFALVLGICGQASGQNPAGMVLYFESGNEVYLLLAEDSKKTRGWAAFGGGAHDGETTAQTAARETEEETRGYFDKADLLKKIQHAEPVIDDNTFALFFAKVDFVPAPVVTKHDPSSEDRSYYERGPYAWIPFSQIEPYVQAKVDRSKKHLIAGEYLPNGSVTNWFWPTWLGNVRKAIETDALPWQN